MIIKEDDDSPKYVEAFGRLTHDRAGYALLMERGRRARWDSRTLIARYDHHVEDVWVNVAYALSLHAMARLSGHPAWRKRARRGKPSNDSSNAAVRVSPWAAKIVGNGDVGQRPLRVALTGSTVSPPVFEVPSERVPTG